MPCVVKMILIVDGSVSLVSLVEDIIGTVGDNVVVVVVVVTTDFAVGINFSKSLLIN